MHMCIHTHMHTHTHTHTHAHTHTYTHACMHVHTHRHIHTHTRTQDQIVLLLLLHSASVHYGEKKVLILKCLYTVNYSSISVAHAVVEATFVFISLCLDVQAASTAPFSEQAEVTVKTNFFSTLNVCEKLFPLLRPHAR